MAYSNTVSLVTRAADLDTQRHTTSRTYESFCLEGRHNLLAEAGYTVRSMAEQGIRILPTHQYVKFMLQQDAGARLLVETSAFTEGNGAILWDQRVKQEDGKMVCHIQTRTVASGHAGLLGTVHEEHDVDVLFHDLDPFTESCSVVESEYTPLFCERDMSGSYSPAQLWKVFEEGRWLFCDRVGLTLDRFIKMDTTSFYMGGVFNYRTPLVPGRKVRIRTWIQRLEKIRFYFRQDVVDDEGVIMSLLDEQVIVSLSAARPRKAPQELADIIRPYIELTDGQ